MSSDAINGWHKITHADGTRMVLHFVDGVSERGFEMREYIRFGASFEPVIVLTPAEYAELQQPVTEAETIAAKSVDTDEEE